jgi:cbb3-type cytochrome oxidase subunit 3
MSSEKWNVPTGGIFTIGVVLMAVFWLGVIVGQIA